MKKSIILALFLGASSAYKLEHKFVTGLGYKDDVDSYKYA